jgi:16S rRNA (guanine966-N2)-methyltransferase
MIKTESNASGGRNSVRIIAGGWRGRARQFPGCIPDSPGLAADPDRVRETLFNWLQHDIAGARCLDLFAGSGALGLEALSRGRQGAGVRRAGGRRPGRAGCRSN